VSSWKFIEDIEVGEMEYGSGYPAGTVIHMTCHGRSKSFEPN